MTFYRRIMLTPSARVLTPKGRYLRADTLAPGSLVLNAKGKPVKVAQLEECACEKLLVLKTTTWHCDVSIPWCTEPWRMDAAEPNQYYAFPKKAVWALPSDLSFTIKHGTVTSTYGLGYVMGFIASVAFIHPQEVVLISDEAEHPAFDTFLLHARACFGHHLAIVKSTSASAAAVRYTLHDPWFVEFVRAFFVEPSHDPSCRVIDETNLCLNVDYVRGLYEGYTALVSSTHVSETLLEQMLWILGLQDRLHLAIGAHQERPIQSPQYAIGNILTIHTIESKYVSSPAGCQALDIQVDEPDEAASAGLFVNNMALRYQSSGSQSL